MEKFVLITGGSSGIGMELAKVFAKAGHNIFLVARSLDKLEANAQYLEKHYSIKTKVTPLDITENGAIEKLLRQINGENIQISHLINNAGFGLQCNFASYQISKQLNMIDLNVRALVELTHAIIPNMQQHGGGKILNVASVAGFVSGPYMSVYYATKAFVLSFSEGIREELLKKKIVVSVLCPGPTESNFWSVSEMSDSNLTKLPWLMSSEEVAKYAYKKLNLGCAVIIPGAFNKISALATQLAPRFINRKMLALIQKRPE